MFMETVLADYDLFCNSSTVLSRFQRLGRKVGCHWEPVHFVVGVKT